MIARPSQNVFIAAISSDIGGALARMYLEEGWNVVGTYRDDSGLESLKHCPGAIRPLRVTPFRPALSACVSKLKCRSRYLR